MLVGLFDGGTARGPSVSIRGFEMRQATQQLATSARDRCSDPSSDRQHERARLIRPSSGLLHRDVIQRPPAYVRPRPARRRALVSVGPRERGKQSEVDVLGHTKASGLRPRGASPEAWSARLRPLTHAPRSRAEGGSSLGPGPAPDGHVHARRLRADRAGHHPASRVVPRRGRRGAARAHLRLHRSRRRRAVPAPRPHGADLPAAPGALSRGRHPGALLLQRRRLPLPAGRRHQRASN